MAFRMAGEGDDGPRNGRIGPCRAQDGGRGASRPQDGMRSRWWYPGWREKKMVVLKMEGDGGPQDGCRKR